MKKKRFLIGWLVLLALVLFQMPAWAQSEVLVVTPNKAVLAPNEGQQFHAQLFSARGVPVPSTVITWKVSPDTLGTITEDGYFVAGASAGTGKVVAILGGRHGMKVHAQARVVISKKRLPLKIEIAPERAAVQPGDTIKFHVKATTLGQIPLSQLNYRWFVMPRNLAHISQKGVFVAGQRNGLATVTVFTEFMGIRYKAEARVLIAPEHSGAIAGTVTDEGTGEPVVRAKVRAIHVGKIPWAAVAQTDSFGNYLLKNLVAGYYVVMTQSKGFITEFYDNVEFMRLATPVEVTNADTIEEINFALKHGAVLEGTVTSEDEGVPLAGAHVQAQLVVNPAVRFHAVADSIGQFSLAGVPSGSYILSASKAGFAKEYYDNASDPKSAKILAVTAGDTLEDLDFTLGAKSAVSGQVLSAADGSPLAGASVFVYRLSPRPMRHWFRHTKTDKNGNYTLPVPAGNYIVGASAKGFGLQYFDGVTKMTDATPVAVVEDQHTTGIDFSLKKLGSFSGIVTDQNSGQPIAGARIMAFSEVWHGKPYAAKTKEDGTFEIPNVRPGIYVLVAKGKDYLPEYFEEATRLKDAKLVSIGMGEAIDGINFTLSRGAILTGTVAEEESGAPIPAALIVAKKIGSPLDYEALSRQDGSYQLSGLLPGKYIVRAMARGYQKEFYLNQAKRDSATVLELAADDSLGGIDFSLNAVTQEAGGITGMIFSAVDSLPVEGAWVMAFPKRKSAPYVTVTGPDGSYSFSNLPSGSYFVLAWAKGFLGKFFDDVRDWKKATPVEVDAPNVVDNISFYLNPVAEGAYSIAGRVLSHNGNQPLDHAFVYAHGRTGASGFAVTDENGNYQIAGIPAGHYRIFAVRPGFWQQVADSTSENDSLDVSVGSGESVASANITMTEVGFTAVNESEGNLLPAAFALHQNYPNPFNPETQIAYELPQSGLVTVNIYNMLGQKVRTLIDKNQAAGVHVVRWAGMNDAGGQVASGVYLIQIQVRSHGKIAFQAVKKMMLMR